MLQLFQFNFFSNGRSLRFLFAVGLSIFLIGDAEAQYFGRNKPKYESRHFQVLKTPHFHIHHYLNQTEPVYRVGEWCEDWYAIHQAIFQDTFKQPNPFILYNNHPDFKQTNTISGSIGEGTGGVTEAFKNRVVLPFAFTNHQTHHVIGHELVHAFQYRMILNGDSTGLESLGNLPLWMVEGLAEYLSVGRIDPHTAMWMRDAVKNDKLPDLDDMNSPEFFPYRYGQAFWSFLTGLYGDEVIQPFFYHTAWQGIKGASDSILNIRFDTLSNSWKRNLTKIYQRQLDSLPDDIPGHPLFKKSPGQMTLSPAISPNGRYVVFLSEKDLFSIDLFVAEVRSGKILQKLTSRVRDGHLDDIAFIESTGAWSPSSDQFAFVGVQDGQNILIIKNVESGKTTRKIRPKGISAFSNPAWSPDGRIIVFSGLVQGQTDLYAYDLRSNRVEQLTHDRYSEIQPSWSDNGEFLTFATDELSIQNGRRNARWSFQPALMNWATKETSVLNIFPTANNLNPVFNHQNELIFISDRDGIRNLYSYHLDSHLVHQLTKVAIGISGLTPFSPAITSLTRRDKMIYSYYQNGKYQLIEADTDDFLYEKVDPMDVDLTAAILPLQNDNVTDIVNPNLNVIDRIQTVDTTSLTMDDYRPRLKLDYIFSSGMGVGIGTGTFGTQAGLAGGINVLFSDMLGDHQLHSAVALNGELIDIGGLVSYINRKNRITWGATLSHVPFRTGSYSRGFGEIEVNGQDVPVYIEQTDILRIFEQQASLFAQYPVSVTQRFELGAGVSYRFFRLDQYQRYYDPNTFIFLGSEREKIEFDGDVNLGGQRIRQALFYSMNAAWVGDNSYFGLASPMAGYRWRVSVDKFFGGINLWSTNADFRYYEWVKPVSFAARFQHYAQFSNDLRNAFPILIGNGQLSLVRGYDYSHLDENSLRYDINFSDLSGTKFFVSSFEIRLPFTGPKRLALISSRFLFTELALFVDAGVAFDDYNQIVWSNEHGDTGPDDNISRRPIVASTGLALRVNVFGAMILEPYYAFPIQKGSKGVFGINIVPGW